MTSRSRQTAWTIAGLAVLALIAHGGALYDGIFFDDHWHRETLRRSDWSWNALIESATIDLPGGVAHLWWQDQPLRWRYARPVAMAAMKLEYELSGGDARITHAFGLLWHLLAACGVWRLARKAGSPSAWAAFAAALFIFYPHSFFAVSWSAARNAQISAATFIWAALAYWKGAEAEENRIRWVTAAIALWLIALLARESAIVFPVVAFGIDCWTPNRQGAARRAIGVWVLMAIIAAGYAAWRLAVFPTAATPGLYFTTPTSARAVVEIAGRWVQALFAAVVYTPMLRGAAISSREFPIAMSVMLVALLTGFASYRFVTRRVAGAALWPLWIAVTLLPVAPVLLMPHFGYLPAAGVVIAIALLASRLRGGARATLLVVTIAGTLWSHGVYRVLWRGVSRGEQLIHAAVAASLQNQDIAALRPKPASRDTNAPAPGTEDRHFETAAGPSKLIFIDLPVAGVYAGVAAREALARDDIECVVLSFAPDVLVARGVADLSQIDVVDTHTLRLTRSGAGFFAGSMGRMILSGLRRAPPPRTGDLIATEELVAKVTDADEDGVRQVAFTFRQPLDSTRYAFFAARPGEPAIRLQFAGAHPPAWSASAVPPNDPRLIERDRYFAIVDFLQACVRSDVFLTGTQ